MTINILSFMIITEHLFYYNLKYEEIKSVFTYYFFGFLGIQIWEENIPSLNQMVEEESGLPIVNLNACHCAVMNLGLQFFFFLYSVVLEGLKNKIKDFLSPYDYKWSI